jgi:hypothetical protein
VQRGHQQQFTVTVLDQFHRAIPPSSIGWSVTGPGLINGNGVYRAPALTKGTAVIKAKVTVNGVTLTGTIILTVL